MNKRTMEIINHLLNKDEMITIKDLAAEYQVTIRTIRNDLNAINKELSNNKLQELSLNRDGRIITSNDFKQIVKYLDSKNFYFYKLSKEERKIIASAMLVNSVSYITLSEIANNLCVSRATIINDLDEIKTFINEAGITVISHANKGLRVKGSEEQIRVFLCQLASYQFPAGLSNYNLGLTLGIKQENLLIIKNVINEQEHIFMDFLTDHSFTQLKNYLAIMVNRNLKGEYIGACHKQVNDKYRFAQEILKYISLYCEITTSENEIDYLSKLLLNSRYIKQKSSDRDTIKIQLVTRQFIDEVSQELNINLYNDYDFFESLSNHMESMFQSDSSSFPYNPALKEIVENNQKAVRAVKNNISKIEEYCGRVITENEIIYIVIHVCAAIERKKNSEITFHVIVACHAGFGAVQLLLEKLKKHFNFQIVDVVSIHDVQNIESEKVDLVVSTAPLENCKIEHVVVSPILNDEDYIRVGNIVDTLRNSRNLPSRIEDKEVTAKGLIDELQPLIKELIPEKAGFVTDAINSRIKDYFSKNQDQKDEIFTPRLQQLLSNNHIKLDVVCSDWRDAIKKSAVSLLEDGYIEESYIDAMIENIEEFGPYIVVSPGFAVPHARLGVGSLKVGMSLIRLKNPVPFGVEALDPVEFVCCLSAVDQKTHLRAFFNLINMLGNQEFKDELKQAVSSQEISSIIKKYEYDVEY